MKLHEKDGAAVDRNRFLDKHVYNILMVDDDECFLKAQSRLLSLVHLSETNVTMKFFVAGSGEEAMSILGREDIDCVLMDLVMPGGDGLTWMKRMLEVSPDLPVIILTGGGNEGVAADAMKKGAVDYLIKGNISAETLARSITNALTSVSMRRYIEDRNKKLMANERMRVMNQTIGAACHHLAQPATILRHCLLIIKRNEVMTDQGREMINQAFKAIDRIYDVIWRLQNVTQYKTEPYMTGNSPDDSGGDNEILSI